MAERVVIIGAGPAGIAAAIQLQREGIQPTILEKNCPGGLLRSANLVENYPGFPDGIPGNELARLFVRQITDAGIEIRHEEIETLDYCSKEYIIKTDRGEFTAPIVVVASGTEPRKFPDFETIPDIENKFFREIIPIIDIENNRIAIVGSGDAAFDYALDLSGANDVTIISRGDRHKCLPLLLERAKRSSRIKILTNAKINDILPDNRGLKLICDGPDGQFEFFADKILSAIGRSPEFGFLSDNLKKNGKSLENAGVLYFIGDVANGIFRQTAISVGDGIRAAMKIGEKILERRCEL